MRNSYSQAIYDNNHQLLRLSLSADDKYRLYTTLPRHITSLDLSNQMLFYHMGRSCVLTELPPNITHLKLSNTALAWGLNWQPEPVKEMVEKYFFSKDSEKSLLNLIDKIRKGDRLDILLLKFHSLNKVSVHGAR